MGSTAPGPPSGSGAKQRSRVLLALVALTTIPSALGQDCLLPETFNPYFQAALDNVESTLANDVVGELDEIGFGPIAQLSINNLLDFKEDVFVPLFGNSIERNEWINVTADVDVKSQLESNLDAIIGSIPPELSVTCQLETTDDLEEGDLPYRFAVEVALSGSFLGMDLDLASLSPEIAVLPEDWFDPLAFTFDSLTVDYELKLPFTIDTKRRKFMIGEILISFEGALNMNVLQSIPLTETVSQNFQGGLTLDASLSYSSMKDWAYTASFDASLTAETSVGTAVANLGLIASDDDVFDDKPREWNGKQSHTLIIHISNVSYFLSDAQQPRSSSILMHANTQI